MERVAVLGAGSWGTALAKLLADKGLDVRLWARREDQARAIEETRENARYLAGFRLPPTLRATWELDRALHRADLVVSVVPTHGLRELLSEAADVLPDVPIVSASKGIEQASLKLVSQIFEELLPERHHHRLTYLSGPSFAREVAAGMPTVVVVGGRDHEVTTQVQHAFATDRFRVYTSDDVVGVEIGGALKNVVAIATGMGDGAGFGHNTRAALITRGLAEIGRLAAKMGGSPLTLAGLAGMGDLVLTCTGDLSRNRHVGLELGKGRKLAEILAEMTMVAEGVKTAKSAHELALREGVEMPITHEVYRILYEDKPPMEAMVSLMTRGLKKESVGS
jgi:glycerol-3-phosphate dehydrogenase (NAD(P)+)